MNSTIFTRSIKLPTQISTNVVLIILFALVELSIVIWTAYDHSIPCWDTAAHKLNSYYVFELLKHPHLKHLDWYRKIFTISPLYPPLFYIMSASFKFIFGQTANTELLCNLFFSAILFFSLHYITKVSFKTRLASLISPVLVFLYPCVFWSTHSALLDFSANAMVALGLACFIWWAQNPQLKRSVILGGVLGLSILTKNNTPIFFIGPVITDMFFTLQENSRTKDFTKVKQYFIVAIVSLLVISPWIILAGPTVSKFIQSIQVQKFNIANQTNSSISQLSWLFDFLSQLQRFTIVDLPLILSPLLFACFLIALINTKTWDKNKIYLISSVVLALLTASIFRWPHQFRYIVPVSIPIAVITADFLSQVWFKHKTVLRIALLSLAFFSLIQFIYEGFSPYPISFPGWLNKIMCFSGGNLKTTLFHSQVPGITLNPQPDCDDGIIWSLYYIEKASSGKATSLMIMPNANPINCSPFYYLSIIRKNNIEVGSPRQHTELGDKVCFDHDQAMWYQWYILKSGDQGLPLCDVQSSASYNKWLDFIRSSGFYKLIDKKPLPDHSSLQLYSKN